MVEVGKYNKFKVLRKSDLGFMLTNDEDEILMHFRQADREYNNGDIVDAFVYFDKEGRYCATTLKVKATTDSIGFAFVKSVSDNGLFVDINTSKDVFLSSDYLPYNKDLWPQVDDEICIILKAKKDSLVAKMVNRQLLDKFKVDELAINCSYEGSIFNINKGGYLIVTKTFNHIFVPFFLTRNKYRIGNNVLVKVTKISDNGYYGTLVPNKENLMNSDKDIILTYLKNNNGFMGLTAKSSSETIESIFKISRKAFKRAYGELYKERKIFFDDKGTYLTK